MVPGADWAGFVAPIIATAAPTTTGDYRLIGTSPAIDAGDNSAVPLDTTDLDGDGVVTETLPYDLAGNSRFFDHPRIEIWRKREAGS